MIDNKELQAKIAVLQMYTESLVHETAPESGVGLALRASAEALADAVQATCDVATNELSVQERILIATTPTTLQ